LAHNRIFVSFNTFNVLGEISPNKWASGGG